MVFIDTSAFYAILDRDDSCHAAARYTWNHLLDSRAPLLTTNYVLLETTAILQRRIGLAAVRTLQEDIIPVLTVDWVTPSRHNAALAAVMTANRRDLSLVDCVSFQVMREAGVRDGFAFDQHFIEQGFRLLPDQADLGT
jgi:predicted nucleic acid-binding protein